MGQKLTKVSGLGVADHDGVWCSLLGMGIPFQCSREYHLIRQLHYHLFHCDYPVMSRSLDLPASPSRPNVKNLILAPFPRLIHNQIPAEPRSRNTSMIRPDPNLLSHLQLLWLHTSSIPNQDPMFLTYLPYLPANMLLRPDTWHSNSWSIPRCNDTPAVVGFTWFSAQGKSSSTKQCFRRSISAAARIQGGNFSDDG